MQDSNNKLKRKKRIMWIDMARGIAMISILLFHTDTYNFKELIIPYELYVENFLALFFFVSGFLFYRENSEFSIKHKLKSILKTIVLPYFIFTACMSVPKALVHGNSLSSDIITDILSGQASWFVTALVVAEILFSVLLKLKYRYVMPAVCFTLGLISVYIEPSFNIWHFHNAMLAMPYLYLGYIYHRHEIAITWFLNNKVFAVSGTTLLIVLKYMELTMNFKMLFEPVIITSFVLFFIDTMLFITLFILLIKHIRSYRIINWTGRNTLVYYFLCGGVPLLTNKMLLLTGIGYGNNLLSLLAITLAVYIITTLFTRIIVKYIPFVTGKF